MSRFATLALSLSALFNVFGASGAVASQVQARQCREYFARDWAISIETRPDQPASLTQALRAFQNQIVTRSNAEMFKFQSDRMHRTWEWLASKLQERGALYALGNTRTRDRWANFRSNFLSPGRSRVTEWRLDWAQARLADETAQILAIGRGWSGLQLEAAVLQTYAWAPPLGHPDYEIHAELNADKFAVLTDELLQQAPQASIFADSARYLVRDMNDLTPFPLFLVGFTSSVLREDSVLYGPIAFPTHDVAHARAIVKGSFERMLLALRNGVISWTRYRDFIAARSAVYGAFRRMTDTVTDPSLRAALDLVWFEIFHELAFFETPMSPNGLRDALSDRIGGTALSRTFLANRITARLRARGYSNEPGFAEMTAQHIREALNMLHALESRLPAWTAAADF